MKVSPIMLLKTNTEKMSETGLAIICMKIIHIEAARHYVYEKKTCYSKWGERKVIAFGGRECSGGWARRSPERTGGMPNRCAGPDLPDPKLPVVVGCRLRFATLMRRKAQIQNLLMEANHS